MGVEDRLDEIIARWREQRDQGNVVDPDEVVRAHPDLEDRLRARFAALAALDELFAESRALAEPAPTDVGPYEIEREIGAGGMGRVYFARKNGAPVALKVLHPHLLARPGFLERFRREAAAGRQIDHPHVVKTIDTGVATTDGAHLHYLVMEFVEGRTLRRVQAEMGRVPEPLLRELAMQVCAGLSAIHDAGLVHRDLKPENVIVTHDERAQVMDLGVAHAHDAQHELTRTGEFAGSLRYAAPEQLGSGSVDARSDLYSLGVVLYELLTGTNPFHWDDVARVVAAHTNHVPTPAHEIDEDVSPFLGEVLTVLLEKDPDARFESAEALGAILQEGERSPWWATREQASLRRGRHRPQIDVRRDTALHGRGNEVEALRAYFDRTRSGKGQTVLIEGEAGIGKTRLVDAFLSGLAEEDAHVLYGSHAPTGGTSAISAAIVRRFGRGALEERLAPALAETPKLVPAFAALLRGEPVPEDRDPLERDVVHGLFATLARTLAAEKPVVWVIDDLHFATADGRATALSLAQALADAPVLLIATSRPGLPEQALAELSRLEHFRRMPISRLSPRQVVELLRDAFRSEALAEALGGKLAYKSDGVPYFIFEMIRGLQDGDFLTREPDGTWSTTEIIRDIEIPSSVWDLIQARLAGLGATERDLLEVAACYGFEFDPVLVGRVLGLETIPALQRFGRIERIHRVLKPAGRQLRFDHHLVQEALYDGLLERLRESYHAAIAEALVEREGLAGADAPPPSGALAEALCRHYLRGRQGHRALRFLGPALDHLEGSHQPESAAELARLALAERDLLGDDARLDILLRLVAFLRLLGRPEEEGTVLDEARDLAGEPADIARVAKELGWHAFLTGDYEAALIDLARAGEEAERAGEHALVAEIEGQIGACLYAQGRYEEARAHQERRMQLARKTGARGPEALAEGSLGILAYAQGRYTEARERLERCIELYADAGSARGLISARGNLGAVCIAQGRMDEALALHASCVETARAIGARHEEAVQLGNMALVLYDQGRVGDARQRMQQRLALSREMADRGGEAGALTNLGRIELHLGDDAAAEALTDAAIERTQELGQRFLEGVATAARASVHAQRGDAATAERHYATALEIYVELGARTAEYARARLDLARLHLGSGRIDEGTAGLRETAALGAELDVPGVHALALAELAVLGEVDPSEALRVLQSASGRVDHRARLETRLLLWRATSEREHLEEAHRMLEYQLEHAPPPCREAMRTNVPTFREITEAWRDTEPET